MLFYSYFFSGLRTLVLLCLAAGFAWPLIPQLMAQSVRMTKEQAQLRDRQLLDSLSLFSARVTGAAAENGSLSRRERWQASFAYFDSHHGWPSGSCAAQLPVMAKRILVMPTLRDLLRGQAFFILGDFDQAEVAVLKHTQAENNASDLCLSWEVAANIALEKGDPDLALARIRKAVAAANPETNFSFWMIAQHGVIRVFQIKGDRSQYLVALREMHRQADNQLGELSGVTLGYQNRVANECYQQGQFAEAEKEYILMLKAINQRPNKDVLQVQILRDNLAKAIAAQGRKEEAENLDLELIRLPKKPNLESKESLDQRSEFGAQLFHEKKYAEAIEQFRTVYDAFRQQLGSEHKDTLNVQNDLAASLHAQGKSAEAAELLRAIIDIRKKNPPLDELRLLENRNNLGNALGGQKLYSDAAEQHRLVAESRTRLLGPNDTKTLDAYINLAADLLDLGQLEEAETIARKVILGREKELGTQHAKTLNGRATLGGILEEAGKMEEAEKERRSIFATSEKAFGSQNAGTLYHGYCLASFLYNVGRMKESRELCSSVLAVNRKTLGLNHPQTTSCEQLLSKLALTAEGQDMTSLASRSVLAKKLNEDGPIHPETMRARTELAHQLQAQKRYVDAAREYETVISVYKKHAYMQTEAAIDARNGQAELLRRMGKISEAEALFRLLLDDCVRVLEEGHIQKAQCLGNLALLFKDKGDHEQALSLQKEALIIFANHHEDSHPSIVKMYVQVANSLRNLQRHDESRVYIQRGYEISKRTLGEKDILTQSLKSILLNPAAFDELPEIPYQFVLDKAPRSLNPIPDQASPHVNDPAPPKILQPIPTGFPGPPNGMNVIEDLKQRWENP